MMLFMMPSTMTFMMPMMSGARGQHPAHDPAADGDDLGPLVRVGDHERLHPRAASARTARAGDRGAAPLDVRSVP